MRKPCALYNKADSLLTSKSFNAIGRLYRDRRGVAALEFAIIGPIMVTLLMLGIYDLGNAAQQQISLHEAVRAGGAYALNHPTEMGKIQDIVKNSLPTELDADQYGRRGCPSRAVAWIRPAALSRGFELDLDGNFASCTTPKSGILISITASMAYTPINPVFAAIIPNSTATYVTRSR